MKILHLLYESKGDCFGIGGVGTRAYEIYKYLKDRHDIILLCKKYPGAKDGEIDGIRHLFAGSESPGLTKTLLSYAARAAMYVREHGEEFDVIVEEFSPAIPTFLHSYTKRPVVLQVQGYTGRLYFKKYNPAYALVLCCMEQLRPRLYNNLILLNKETGGKIPVKKNGLIEIIPNGVSPELLDAEPFDGDYILYLGRLDVYGKGIDLLIKAYAEFAGLYPYIRLVIAGDGRDADDFKAMLMRLPEGVRKNIEAPGWVSGNKKRELIRGALYVVFPSRHEVQPIAVLEAMAAGKAVVVSGIPEFNFVTENKAGISFKSGDAAGLAGSMKGMMASADRREMGGKGRSIVRDYTWDKIAAEFEGFLEGIISRHRL